MPETAKSKAGWSTVAFGDVVRQVKDKVAPEASGLERYIAGEHMDTDDLRIRRWGDIGDGYLGPAFHMRFKSGHVLYGSRRTYLRKVSLADFEGITANTTYVLESKDPDVLLPELLPFIMQAEPFHAHSKRESKGSVNPYVNFSDLAWYEFALPPLEEQRRMAEALRATEQNINALRRVIDRSRRLREAALKHSFPVGQPLWKVDQQTELERIVDAIIDYRGRTPTKTECGVPLITAKNIRVGYVDAEPREYIAEDQFGAWMTRGLPAASDILFTTEAPLANVAMAPDYKFAMAQRVLLLRAATAQVSPRFLYWMLQGPSMRRQIFSRATGSTAKGIKQSSLRRIPVLLPDLDAQRAICEMLDAIGQSLDALIDRLETAQTIHFSLLRGLLS